MLSITEINPDLTVEGTPRLLEAEIVVKLLVGQVATLEREIISPVPYAVAQRQVV